MPGLLGKKIGMTSFFTEDGNSLPVTVLEVGPCTVYSKKTVERDGYKSIQLGYGNKKENKLNRAQKEFFAKVNSKPVKFLREFKNFSNYDEISVGDEFNVDLFQEGEKVVVTGVSKGKGFQGVMKRHGFGGVGGTTHGQKDRLRAPGSIGQSSYPSRVFKGTRMGGRTGNQKTSVKNLRIVQIIPSENIILVEGAVPGSINSIIEINKVIGKEMKLDVYKIDGSKSGETVNLEKNVFGIEPNDHVIYLSVKAHLANKRQGTHKAKERNEVRGGGRKPWKQKGRGTARAGTIRSPLWVGGGTIFGPKPRDYSQSLNKKVKKIARKSAFSHKAKAEQIIVVEDFNFDAPKTKDFNSVLKSLNLDGKRTLLLTADNLENVYKSGRNIPKVNVLEAINASTYDIVNNQVLLLQKGAIEKIVNLLN